MAWNLGLAVLGGGGAASGTAGTAGTAAGRRDLGCSGLEGSGLGLGVVAGLDLAGGSSGPMKGLVVLVVVASGIPAGNCLNPLGILGATGAAGSGCLNTVLGGLPLTDTGVVWGVS